MILIALIATGIDWLTHNLGAEHVTASEYFSDKIIYATIIGLIGLGVLRNENDMTRKAVWISLVTAITLHGRYYIQGYEPSFVVLFLLAHFFAIFLPMLVVFKNFPELFGNPIKESSIARATLSRFKGLGKTGQ